MSVDMLNTATETQRHRETGMQAAALCLCVSVPLWLCS
jgi:hypothetical protein